MDTKETIWNLSAFKRQFFVLLVKCNIGRFPRNWYPKKKVCQDLWILLQNVLNYTKLVTEVFHVPVGIIKTMVPLFKKSKLIMNLTALAFMKTHCTWFHCWRTLFVGTNLKFAAEHLDNDLWNTWIINSVKKRQKSLPVIAYTMCGEEMTLHIIHKIFL